MNHVNEIKLIGVVTGKIQVFPGPEVKKIMFQLTTSTSEPQIRRDNYPCRVIHQIETLMMHGADIPELGDTVRLSGYMKNSQWPNRNTGKMIYKYFMLAKTIEILD